MSSPTPLRLRPLEIGDVLDETFRLYRRNFVLIAGVSVAFSIPFAALAGFGFWSLFTTALNTAASGQPTAANLSGELNGLLAGFGVGYLVNIGLLPLQYGAVLFAICQSALGNRVTLGGMLRAAVRRYLHVLGFIVLAALMGLFFCLFPLWIWILVGWVAVLPAIFTENLSLGAAMGRSWGLVRGMWWRTFLILVLMFVIEYAVSLALGGFLYLGQALLTIVLSNYVVLAVYEGAAIVASAVTFPIVLIAMVLLYFDLRVRKEGIDLFQLASRLTSQPPALA